MSDNPFANVDLGAVVEPMASKIGNAPAIVEPTADVSEPEVPLANVELGAVVEPMADVVTVRLRFKPGIPLAIVERLASGTGVES